MTPERFQQIEELYHAAREGTPEQREALLVQTAPELRREVESLLARRSGGEFLDQPAIRNAPELLEDPPVTQLTAGACLGPYQIESKLGEGGMGVVYKARDTRLNRTVAIKLSTAQFSGRFEREARAVAALNHPHICTLYEVGPDYLAMEYVEGKPLSGPLPPGEALRLAGQLLDALTAAHAKGIVHRDLKPANILVTKAGIKVLDFGLAKMTAGALSAEAPTETATQAGAILGTLQYMSPEQVQGKEVDARSDIFSFGLVLYEMLTGKRAFDGGNSASIMAAILERDAPALEPEGLNRVVKACLAKDPDERFQSARDVKRAIEWSASADGEAPSRRSWLGWSVAALAGGSAAAAFLHFRERPAPTSPTVRFNLDMTPAESLTGAAGRPIQAQMVFSPDGNTLVFSGSRGSDANTSIQLYKRALDQSEAVPIPGSENAEGPFFSPDGKWVGFWAAEKLRKIAISGGPAVSICDLSLEPWGATWGSEGMIVFADRTGPLMRVPAGGGTPQALAEPDRAKGELFTSPEFLPDGRTLLFTARTSDNWEEAQIVARRPEGGAPRVLLKGGTNARYVQTGHLLYLNNAVLMAVPFDSQKLECAGTLVALLDGVMQAVNTPNSGSESGLGQFSVSHSGNLVYALGGIYPTRSTELVRIDRKGAVSDLNLKGDDWGLRLSPDGRRLAVCRTREGSRLSNIWTCDLIRGTASRLTNLPGQNSWPLWTRDSKRILFSGGLGQRQILSVMADRQGSIETVAASKKFLAASSWSPDGKWLAYLDGGQIWIRPASGEGEARLFLESKFSLRDPEFSPDGKWMAYSSNESGTLEVYVQAFPGPGEKVRISTDRGSNPAWSPNGHELFYLNRKPPRSMIVMAVDIVGSPRSAGTPRKLFEVEWSLITSPVRSYDVYPDGQSFIMARVDPLPDLRATHLNVVLNFFDELQRRVPRSGKETRP